MSLELWLRRINRVLIAVSMAIVLGSVLSAAAMYRLEGKFETLASSLDAVQFIGLRPGSKEKLQGKLIALGRDRSLWIGNPKTLIKAWLYLLLRCHISNGRLTYLEYTDWFIFFDSPYARETETLLKRYVMARVKTVSDDKIFHDFPDLYAHSDSPVDRGNNAN